jgi:hypothetical protein
MYANHEAMRQIAYQKMNDMIEEARRYRMAEEARKGRQVPGRMDSFVAWVRENVGRGANEAAQPAVVGKRHAIADPA